MVESFQSQVNSYLVRGFPALWIQTAEYERVIPDLVSICGSVKGEKVRFYEWNCLDGVRERVKTGWASCGEDTKDPLAALEWVRKLSMPERSMLILKDYHFHVSGVEAIEEIRQLVEICKASFRMLVFLAPVVEIPKELEKLIVLVEHRLPNHDDLESVIRQNLDFAADAVKKMPEKDLYLVVDSARGLTAFEAEQAFALAYKDKQFSREVIQTQKKQILAKTQILEYVESVCSLEDVGGMDEYKKWLRQRSMSFTPEARKYGLPLPRGVLSVGPPGVGKSVSAKAIAYEWKMPLLRLDMGRMFAGLVGASEANMRQAIRVAEAMSPVILWVDEIEKGFSGIKSSGSTDSGVTARVASTFLTWMQERTDPVFVYATANDVTKLPPELIRKGRFDEMFYIGLPNPAERKSIWEIHLRKVKRDPKNFDVKDLVARTLNYTGAEIEAVLHDGMFTAFALGKEVNDLHLMNSIQRTHPISQTMGETIAEGMKWGRERARMATAEEKVEGGRKSLD